MLESKIMAVKAAPAPADPTQLKAWLGKVTFYDKFLPNRASVFSPLYNLLKKDAPWEWGRREQEAFDRGKAMFCSEKVLVHYSLDLPLLLSVDASSYGCWGVLAPKMSDGTELPIAFVSRTFSAAERNYSTLDRELGALVWCVRRLHQYIAGRHCTVYTDHKPLVGLQNPTPYIINPRALRWPLLLGAHRRMVCYRAGLDNANSDALSRLLLAHTSADIPLDPGDVFFLCPLPISPPVLPQDTSFSVRSMAYLSKTDPELGPVLRYVCSAWPVMKREDAIFPYYVRRSEFAVEQVRVSGMGPSRGLTTRVTSFGVGGPSASPSGCVLDEKPR